MARRAAGEYIHPIIIRRMDVTPNGFGQLMPTPVEVCRRLARIESPSGRELTLPEGSQQLGVNVVSLCVGYDSQTTTITNKHHVIFDGKTLEITSARDVTGRREEIQMDCVESETA